MLKGTQMVGGCFFEIFEMYMVHFPKKNHKISENLQWRSTDEQKFFGKGGGGSPDFYPDFRFQISAFKILPMHSLNIFLQVHHSIFLGA